MKREGVSVATGENARRLVRLLQEHPDRYTLNEIRDIIGASTSYTAKLVEVFGERGDELVERQDVQRLVPVWHLARAVRELHVSSLEEMIEAMEEGWELLFMSTGQDWALMDFITRKGRVRVVVRDVALDSKEEWEPPPWDSPLSEP